MTSTRGKYVPRFISSRNPYIGSRTPRITRKRSTTGSNSFVFIFLYYMFLYFFYFYFFILYSILFFFKAVSYIMPNIFSDQRVMLVLNELAEAFPIRHNKRKELVRILYFFRIYKFSEFFRIPNLVI